MFSGQIAFEPTDATQVGQSDADRSGAIACQIDSQIACQIDSHLALRSLKPSDADALFALVEANRAYLRQWLPWLDASKTVDDLLSFIHNSAIRAEDNNGFDAAICYDTQIVGIVSLNYIIWNHRLSNIGYWLAESYQGSGIVTRTCKAVLSYGFTTLNLNRIEIRCAPQNIRSQAVAKRLGLAYEGTLRDAEWLYDRFVDHQIYSMLQREWQSSAS